MIIFAYSARAQNTHRRYPIFIAEYDFIFTPQNGCIDTVSGHLQNGNSVRIKLYSCSGKMTIKVYDRNSKLVEEGQYMNSLDLLKKYTNLINVDSKKSVVKVYAYYQPLRTGEWRFYDSKGNIEFKKNYYVGSLRDSTILLSK